MNEIVVSTPDEMFSFGERIAETLECGDLILLYGGLGVGKTLLAKGILRALDFDIDEVTSPSFTLVNLYKTQRFDVFHIDLWRLDQAPDPAEAVGLGEILENQRAVTIIEWAERLGERSFPNRTLILEIEGDGDEPRKIKMKGLRINTMLISS